MSDATLVWHRWAHRSSASHGRHEPTIGDETKHSKDKNCNHYNAMNNRHSSGQLGNYVGSSTSPASERPVVKLKRDGGTNEANLSLQYCDRLPCRHPTIDPMQTILPKARKSKDIPCTRIVAGYKRSSPIHKPTVTHTQNIHKRQKHIQAVS
ncbi:unnamed protein product [Ixodes pacificus]